MCSSPCFEAWPLQRKTYSAIALLENIGKAVRFSSIAASLTLTPHVDHAVCLGSYCCSQPPLSHTNTQTHTHTPLLSHAATLHNSNSAFIPLPLFSPWSLSPLIFLLLLAPSSCFHAVLCFPPRQICVASGTLHFLHITFICIPLSSSSPSSFRSLSFTCPEGNLFTASLPVSQSAILTFSPTHATRENDDREGVCHPAKASNHPPVSLCPNPQLQNYRITLCRLDEWPVVETKAERAGVLHEKLNDKSQGRWRSQHRAPLKGVKSTSDSWLLHEVNFGLLKTGFCYRVKQRQTFLLQKIKTYPYKPANATVQYLELFQGFKRYCPAKLFHSHLLYFRDIE